MSGARRIALTLLLVGCAPATPTPNPAPSSGRDQPAPAAVTDSGASNLIAAGFGTRRRDDIAIKLQPENVLVSFIPLDESVIRVLATDSYRYLHDILESRRTELARAAQQFGLRRGSIWYVELTGLTPDARYNPTDVTITSGGRDFRPVNITALKSGFGTQRLQPRELQYALYLFDDAVDVSQPLTVTMGSERNSDWDRILRTLESERAQIRARSARKP